MRLLLHTDVMSIYTMNAFMIVDYTMTIYLATSSLLTLLIVDRGKDWCVLVLAPVCYTGMEYLSPLVVLLLFIIPLSYFSHQFPANLNPVTLQQPKEICKRLCAFFEPTNDIQLLPCLTIIWLCLHLL